MRTLQRSLTEALIRLDGAGQAASMVEVAGLMTVRAERWNCDAQPLAMDRLSRELPTKPSQQVQ